MAEQKKFEERTEGQNPGATTGDEKESGDPGRTPGQAEGDERTVDESLQRKEVGAK